MAFGDPPRDLLQKDFIDKSQATVNYRTREYDNPTSSNPSPQNEPSRAGFVPRPEPVSQSCVVRWGIDHQHHQHHQTTSTSIGQLTCTDRPRENDDGEDDDRPPFTPPPPKERLSYTRYQLALLNGIYQEVRYPNGTQKQLIAKRVGITREQVKIWFQNRRRKDVVTKGSDKNKDSKAAGNSIETNNPSPDVHVGSDSSNHFEEEKINKDEPAPGGENVHSSVITTNGVANFSSPNNLPSVAGSTATNNDTGVSELQPANGTAASAGPSSSITTVSPMVLRSIITELNKFGTEYLKMKKKKKRSKTKATKTSAPAVVPLPPTSTSLPTSTSTSNTLLSSLSSFSSLSSCKAPRLFQSYDMIAPPNKLTPSANKVLHTSEASAFRDPRYDKAPLSGAVAAEGAPQLREGFSSHRPGDSLDFLQQRPLEHMHGSSHPSFSSQPCQPTLNTLFPSHAVPQSMPQHPAMYDNVLGLTDFLSSYSSHQASAAMAQRPMGQSLFSASTTPGGSTSDHKSTGGLSYNSSHYPIYQPRPTPQFTPLSRVYPFPLIADPPMVLSGMCQPDTYFHRPQWQPHPLALSSQTPPHNSPSGIPEDAYRPLVITSLSNPYYSSASSTYSSSSSTLPHQSSMWSPQSDISDLNNNFTDL
ncbi:uncharacterized protein LOC131946780 [Physella acuta]|uniref:uncharacterized protein LOC131946780 n=1 Tax=Physella acuta TaxID=109671 RepID=UPI0027DCD3E6|nr:uncharacterized protein LOC131946780 [Physella acuta]